MFSIAAGCARTIIFVVSIANRLFSIGFYVINSEVFQGDIYLKRTFNPLQMMNGFLRGVRSPPPVTNCYPFEFMCFECRNMQRIQKKIENKRYELETSSRSISNRIWGDVKILTNYLNDDAKHSLNDEYVIRVYLP